MFYEIEINQSGVVPSYFLNGELNYVLITSNNSAEWIFP